MRKIIFCLLFSMALVQLLAQKGKRTTKIGAGINITDFLKSTDTTSAKGKVGFQVGSAIVFGKKVYGEIGAYYLKKSTEVTLFDGGQPEMFDGNVSGFRIPVAGGVNLLENNKSSLGLRVFGGGSVFFITAVGEDVDEEEINETNWGVFAGAGIDISILYIELLYEWSVTDIQEDVSQVDFGQSRSFFITAGLRF